MLISAAGFSLYFDYFGNEAPDGVYHIVLWLDPNGYLAESNEFDNASLSWGTIQIGIGAGGGSEASMADASSAAPGSVYNGKILPARGEPARKVRVTTASQGRRRVELLGDDGSADDGPSSRAARPARRSKLARARQQVIFPVAEMKAMPQAD